MIKANPVEKIIYQKPEPAITDITLGETYRSIDRLNNWKAPGSDNIQAKVIIYFREGIYTLSI